MSVPFPFRTESHSATPDELARANEESGLAGGRHPFLPLTEELQKFQQREERMKEPIFKHQHCLTYAHHPDERVVLELIRRPPLRGTYWYFFLNVYARSRHPSLWKRWGLPRDYAGRGRKNPGDLPDVGPDPLPPPAWDPLLDAMDRAGQWPSSPDPHPLYFAHAEGFVPQLEVARLLENDPRVVAWLKSAPSLEEWLRLRAFRSVRFLSYLATQAPEIPEGALPVLFHNPETWPALSLRPEAAVRRFLRQTSEQEVVEEARSFPRSHFTSIGQSEWAFRTLQHTRSRADTLAPASRAALRSLLEGRAQEQKRWGVAELRFLEALTDDSHLSATELEELYELASPFAVEHRKRPLKKIVESPSAPPALWLRLLAEQKSSRLRLLLAAHPPAARHPEVRPLLLRSRDPEILLALCQGTAGAEFASLFRQISALGDQAQALARVLEQASPEQIASLSREDLLPLLSSADASARLIAIRLQSQLPAPSADKGPRAAPGPASRASR